MHRQWPKEPHTAPARGKIGPNKLAFKLGAKGSVRIRQPPRPNIVNIRSERGRVSDTQERAECDPPDALSDGQITLAKRSNNDLLPVLWLRCHRSPHIVSQHKGLLEPQPNNILDTPGIMVLVGSRPIGHVLRDR